MSELSRSEHRTVDVPGESREPDQELWQQWRQGQRPEVGKFLAGAGPVSLTQLVAVLAVDQRERWQSGERIPAELYLKQYPALQVDFEKALELVYGEFLLREQLGETPVQQEYLQRFPQYAERLRQQLSLHDALAFASLQQTSVVENTDLPYAAEQRAETMSIRCPHCHNAVRLGAEDIPSQQEQHALTEPWPVRAAWEKDAEASTLPPGEPIGSAAQAERPTVVGYQILEELGRGGMGVVYKARQLGLRRLVALKMILAGSYAGAAELERFRREAEAVARLQHPHIVQIYEVGQQAGRPYFSLEFAEGGSLAQKLRGIPLPTRQAAQMVQTLAQAVHAAHERGIIHRDLKPANVLLTANGVPKITDFGLSKRLDAEALTQSGAIMGTPSYMAPEQARGKPKEIGPAADIYALGAILYELLTGRPPFRADTPLETVRQVLDDEVVPPRRLQPKIHLDLNTICLHCLHKEPDKRYRSAQALAEDLGRFLAGEPIQARPVRPWERALKWARRRPALAAVSAGFVLMLAGSLAGLSALYIRAEKQRGLADAARYRAEQSEAASKAVNGFLIDDVMGAAQPKPEGLGPSVTVREALDAALAKIDQAFAGQPAAEAGVRYALGTSYLKFGAYEQARPQIDKALALSRQTLGENDRLTLNSQLMLGRLLQYGNDHDGAEHLFRQTYEALRDHYGPEDEDTLVCMDDYANLLRVRRRLGEAEPLYRAALEIVAHKYGSDHDRTLGALDGLGKLYASQAKYSEAVEIYRRLVNIMRIKEGPDVLNTLIVQGRLGETLLEVKEFAEAEEVLDQTLQGRRRVLNDRWHPTTLTIQLALARARMGRGNLPGAESLLRDAVAGYDTLIARQRLPANFFMYGWAKCLLGGVYVELERYDEAESLLLAGYQIIDTSATRLPARSSQAVNSLIRLYEKWDKPDKAAAWRAKQP